MKRIMFTGHRDKTCNETLLDQIPRNALWIHGGAIGFDTQVENYAQKHGIATSVFRPNYKKYGRRAPLIRNDEMLNLCDEVVAFYDGRKSGGTYYAVEMARIRGKKITFIKEQKGSKVDSNDNPKQAEATSGIA